MTALDVDSYENIVLGGYSSLSNVALMFKNAEDGPIRWAHYLDGYAGSLSDLRFFPDA